MKKQTPKLIAAICAAALLLSARHACAYIEAAYTLGKVISDSTNVLVMTVEKVDRQKNCIIYRKVRDIKGTHPGDLIKHTIGQGGFHPREWQNIMAWAQEGKQAVLFHNGGTGEICIDNYWYQSAAGEWWSLNHAEPYLLRTYAGKPERLATAVAAMLAGQEVTVPCMVDGNKDALHLRTAKLQRMKASLKIQDYNPKRDFVEGGADAQESRAIAGMPGFTHYLALNRLGPETLGIAPADFNGDGKLDLLLFGVSHVALFQNAGGSFEEVSLGLNIGARAAAWADYDGDGKPDLLLATPAGPKVFHNDGKRLEEAPGVLPLDNYYNLTAAAWIDYDGDGKPDILLADGFRGLRLYRNKGAQSAESKPGLGKWYYAGPFDSPDGRGFDIVYPPEREINLSAQYRGKKNEPVTWRQKDFRDGQVNNLRLFKGDCNDNCVVYLYRELDYGGAVDLPVGLGSDDTLTVWLNGEKVHAENVNRGCQPDQVHLNLRLRPGRNALLMKVCNGSGDYAFAFSAKDPGRVWPQVFEDVSDAVGLGAAGVGGNLKGDHLVVADVNGDGRPDFLYSAGTGLLVLNTPQGFVEAKNCGIAYRSGKVAPVFGVNGDGKPDLLVPQRGVCRLFRNDGGARFTDVTAKSGDLARPVGDARCAVWSDFQQRGRLDLFIGCVKGPNRYFRNNATGVFTDATDEIGLTYSIFNTCGLAVADFNGDKMPDIVLNNEGQDSAVLLGNASWPAEETRRLAEAAAGAKKTDVAVAKTSDQKQPPPAAAGPEKNEPAPAVAAKAAVADNVAAAEKPVVAEKAAVAEKPAAAEKVVAEKPAVAEKVAVAEKPAAADNVAVPEKMDAAVKPPSQETVAKAPTAEPKAASSGDDRQGTAASGVPASSQPTEAPPAESGANRQVAAREAAGPSQLAAAAADPAPPDSTASIWTYLLSFSRMIVLCIVLLIVISVVIWCLTLA